MLRLLADWGAGAGGAGEPIQHELCGTALETRWWCPTCAVVVDDPDVRETRTRLGRTLAGMTPGEPHTMDDPRWEPGMPTLDRQAVRAPVLPPSLQGLPPRSVPEVAPTPLQQHYVLLSVAGADPRRDRDHRARARARRSAARWSSCAC